MLTNFLKKFPTKPFSEARKTLKISTLPFRSFCTEPPNVNANLEEEYRASLKEGSANLEHLRSYFLDLYRPFSKSLCLIAPSAYLSTSFLPPLGSPYLIKTFVAGAAIHMGATLKLDNTEPTVTVETTSTGETETVFDNSSSRRLYYAISTMGQGWMFAFATQLGLLSPALLPVALVGCLSSNIGQYLYFKKFLKSGFSPISLFGWGTLTGSLGMGLVGCGLLAPLGIFIPPDLLVLMSLGVVSYNLAVVYTCNSIFKALASNQIDPLRHLGWLGCCWNAIFLPVFALIFYIFYGPKAVNEEDKGSQPNTQEGKSTL